MEQFTDITGLRVNPKKSHGFLIGGTAGKYTVNECEAWAFHGEPMHMVGATESVRYLGVLVGPSKWITIPDLRDTLQDLTTKIGRAPLKPSQRLEILRNYAIPRLIYAADLGRAGHSTLEGCDRDIRDKVKSWLHLEPFTADGLLYSSLKDGGLGLVQLATQVPAMQLRRLLGMYNSDDACVKAVARATIKPKTLTKLWTWSKGTKRKAGEGPIDPSGLNLSEVSTAARRRASFDRWRGLKEQGVGITSFLNDPISNSWLVAPKTARLK